MTTATPVAAPQPGSVPGLELQEKIGEGGMSVVYRARHLALQRTVAVKILHAPSAEASAAWLRESRLTAALAHPHVITVHDAGQVAGHNYLVMEHLAGGSLRARMKPGEPWPLQRALALLDRVAQALEHIHAQGVLHLDLKPENILYGDNGDIKVADFGISVPHADAQALLGGRRFQGSLDYCAPEHRTGLALDGRFDVFSLATLTYELLTGRLPGRVYVPASQRNPQLPVALDDVLRRGLARDAVDRHASIAEFRRELTQAATSSAAPGPRRRPIAVGSALALALVALLAYVFRPLTPPAPEPKVSQLAPPPPPAVERPERVWIVCDQPSDTAFFRGPRGAELLKSSVVPTERIVFEPTGTIPAEWLVPAWPAPRPLLLVRSSAAWGFIHPFRDRTLGQRALDQWAQLIRATVPAKRNLVKAGDFEGDCLTKSHDGALWRAGEAADWDAKHGIDLATSSDQPENTMLVLTNLDPARARSRLRCLQPFAAPPPGAALVLRYRARSLHGKGTLSIHAAFPVVIPNDDSKGGAIRVRTVGTRLEPEPADTTPDRYLYWCPAAVTPTTDWRTYLVVFESPPYRLRTLHRNVMIDLTASEPAEADRVWVDDVNLFVWEPGNVP